METAENNVATPESTAPVSAPVEKSTSEVSVGDSERKGTEVKPAGEKPKSLRERITENYKADKPSKKPSKVVGSAPVVAAPVQAASPVLPPADMSKEDKEVFMRADPAMQAYLSKRAYEMRNDYTQKTMQLAQERRELQAINETIGEYRDHYAKEGVRTEDVVRRAIAWDQFFKKDKVQAGREFLAAQGLDPEDLIGLDGEAPPQPQFNPQDIESMVEERLNRKFEAINQEQSTRSMFSDVEKFKGSKPLFKDPGTGAELEKAMAPRVQMLRATDPSASNAEILNRAYEEVVALVPQFKELHQRMNASTEARQSQSEAQRAIQASRSISGAPGGSTPVKKIKDLRANIKARLRNEI